MMTALIIVLPLLSALLVYVLVQKKASGIKNSLVVAEAANEQLRGQIAAVQKSCDDRLAEKEKACEREMQTLQASCERTIRDKDAACEKLLRERESSYERMIAEKAHYLERQFCAQKESMEKASKILQEQFTTLAADLLSSRSKDLSEKNAQQIGEILKPLREQMETFRKAAREAQDSNIKIGSEIQAKILTIQQTAHSLGQKAEGLANALQGGNKIQGNWGEQVLQTVLDSCHLKKGVNYFAQEGTSGVGIPDVQVIDPVGRIVVIDSKTSLTDYVDACNATDPALRNEKLKAHVLSVRRHVDELARKDYVGNLRRANPQKNYLNVVAMFVPNEGAHAAALAAEPSLVQYALEKGIVLVTPLTLLGYLRLISLAWQQDQVDKNHEEIIKQAQTLLDRVNKCFLALEGLGDQLAGAQASYESVMGLVGKRGGVQNLLTPADKLIKLGVKLEKGKSKRNHSKLLFEAQREEEVHDC